MFDFLKSNTPDSSLRVNMLIITVPVGMILFAVFFHIMYRTVSPVEITYVSKNDLKYVYSDIPWLALAGFVGGIIGALVTVWYGKKINKDAENETPKPGDPAQPNQNPPNLQL